MKNGLEETKTVLWTSMCLPSSQARVTTLNSLSVLNSLKACDIFLEIVSIEDKEIVSIEDRAFLRNPSSKKKIEHTDKSLKQKVSENLSMGAFSSGDISANL